MAGVNNRQPLDSLFDDMLTNGMITDGMDFNIINEPIPASANNKKSSNTQPASVAEDYNKRYTTNHYYPNDSDNAELRQQNIVSKSGRQVSQSPNPQRASSNPQQPRNNVVSNPSSQPNMQNRSNQQNNIQNNQQNRMNTQNSTNNMNNQQRNNNDYVKFGTSSRDIYLDKKALLFMCMVGFIIFIFYTFSISPRLNNVPLFNLGNNGALRTSLKGVEKDLKDGTAEYKQLNKETLALNYDKYVNVNSDFITYFIRVKTSEDKTFNIEVNELTFRKLDANGIVPVSFDIINLNDKKYYINPKLVIN